MESAERVELDLPETGVCSIGTKSSGEPEITEEVSSSCCTPVTKSSSCCS